MIPIYKLGGPHKKDGINYFFDAVSLNDLDSYLCDGWHRDFEELKIEEAEYVVVKPTRKRKAKKDDGNDE